jgi:hypothetical protein
VAAEEGGEEGEAREQEQEQDQMSTRRGAPARGPDCQDILPLSPRDPQQPLRARPSYSSCKGKGNKSAQQPDCHTSCMCPQKTHVGSSPAGGKPSALRALARAASYLAFSDSLMAASSFLRLSRVAS